MDKQVKCGDVSAGKVDGIGPTHAVVFCGSGGEWFVLCENGKDLEGEADQEVRNDHLTPGARVTCAGCERTLRLLNEQAARQ